MDPLRPFRNWNRFARPHVQLPYHVEFDGYVPVSCLRIVAI